MGVGKQFNSWVCWILLKITLGKKILKRQLRETKICTSDTSRISMNTLLAVENYEEMKLSE